MPREISAIFEDGRLSSRLQQLFGERITPIYQKMIRIFGLPESVVGERVQSCSLPDEVHLAYRATFPEVAVLLRRTIEPAHLVKEAERITAALGKNFVFSDCIMLPQCVHELLLNSGLTLSSLESCSGGLLGSKLTAFPGASSYYKGGFVCYSNSSKIKLAGVNQKTLEVHGAVSAECASELALGVKESLKSDLALSITGIAGPSGGSAEKPVGTFFVGFAVKNGEVRSYRYVYPAERERIRTFAVWCALDVLRRHLLSLPLREDGLIGACNC